MCNYSCYSLKHLTAMLSQTELKEVLDTSLQELGLTENEKGLYLTSLQLGPSTISALGEALAVPRPYVYKLIEALERVGLAKFSERKKYLRTFMVESPSKLMELVRAKKEQLEQQNQTLLQKMPDLLALYRQGELPTSVRIYQGETEYYKLFFQMLEEAQGEILSFGAGEEYVKSFPALETSRWSKERLARKIWLKTLSLPTKLLEPVLDPSDYRETKILSTMNPFVTSFQIFGKKAAIWQPEARLALLIEDEFITQMLKSIFDLLWNQPPHPPKI